MTKKKIELVQSSVIFTEDPHSYTTTEGLVLSGVTGLLSRQLFQDKYSDVPEKILEAAAERGTAIHKDVEDLNNGAKEAVTEEGEAYLSLKIKPLAAEYLVSDNINFATKIDIVGQDLMLYDVKTNKSGIDKMYVQWQLSCNAYLFEMQNPGLKVKGLAGIWLNGDIAEICPVERIDDAVIKDLMQADSLDLPFQNPFSAEVQTIDIDELVSIESKLSEFMKVVDELKKKKEDILSKIKESLIEQERNGGGKTIDMETIRFTLVKGSERKTFDSKRFEKDDPETYEKYIKKSTSSPYVKMTVREIA